jgi:hypothetical protein
MSWESALQSAIEVAIGIAGFSGIVGAVAGKAARESRMKENRAVGCGVCVGETSSEALLLRRPGSRMS